MEHVILAIHLILALCIIGLVLLQRSEGGGLGIGGSGGLGGLATPGGTANALSRMTAICAACFFATSLILGIMGGGARRDVSLLDQIGAMPAAAEAPADAAGDTAPAVPVEEEEKTEGAENGAAPSVPVE